MSRDNRSMPGHKGGPNAISMPGEKSDNPKMALSKLISYCKPMLFIILLALLMAFVASSFSIFGPSQLSKITDLVTTGISSEIDMLQITQTAIFLMSLYIAAIFFNYFQGFIMATVTQRVSKNLRKDISSKINRLPLKYFDTHSYGDILSRVTNDVDTISQTMNQSLGQLASQIATFIGAILMMFYTNWVLASTALVSAFLGFAFMNIIIKKSQKHFVEQQKELGKINGYIEEMYSGQSIVRVYNAESNTIEKFQAINENLYNSAWKAQFLSGMMMPLMSFIGNLGYVSVCIMGAILAKEGYISFGVIVAFMVYVRLFTQPLSQIAQIANNLQSTAAASERVFDFLEEKELDNEDHKPSVSIETIGKVEFKNVTFGYDKDKTIINNLSAIAHPGAKIAIVGPTGAGKTTIINLLMRFYEINSGEILLDDISTKDMKREDVHNKFCMVLQDTWLFEGTIRDNIIYGKEGVTDEDLDKVCEAVGLKHFIATLPKKYDTVLDDKTSLSAGQKQLVTIARAMVENAPLLILDEATSSVDTRTEKIIQTAMDRLTKGRTSFVIAHRLSTIKNADLILVMKDGDIIESGNHETLLESKGFYADLYNSQFEN